ncbi:MAG: M24 family metallopeptidase [Acidobacteria bacterium]|nr:M24 family metallopeptidase [Acidobacteriota bacterium]
MSFDLKRIQDSLNEKGMDGWLLTDFHHRDLMAYRILGLPVKFTSRRWFYFIPAEGEPIRLVSKVESTKLDPLPGEKRTYLSWKELHQSLRDMVSGHNKIAMQYSPMNNIPYVSVVDGGTVELIRSFGVEVVTSADLVQEFEAIIDEAGYQSHLEAGRLVQGIKDEAFARIREFLDRGERLTEYELQQFIARRFEEEGLNCMEEYPIVGVNAHPADPHFEPTAENSVAFKEGDQVLIDLWAKLDRPGAIFYDITWCGYIGQNPPADYVEVFHVVRDARKAAVDFVRDRFSRGEKVFGYEVDDACRKVVVDAGYGEYFVHRTGHSIGEEVHGNGVNIDNLETMDERQLMPGICFSVEPGIYIPDKVGVRTEIDVFITLKGEVIVAGDEQEELILI